MILFLIACTSNQKEDEELINRYSAKIINILEQKYQRTFEIDEIEKKLMHLGGPEIITANVSTTDDTIGRITFKVDSFIDNSKPIEIQENFLSELMNKEVTVRLQKNIENNFNNNSVILDFYFSISKILKENTDSIKPQEQYLSAGLSKYSSSIEPIVRIISFGNKDDYKSQINNLYETLKLLNEYNFGINSSLYFDVFLEDVEKQVLKNKEKYLSRHSIERVTSIKNGELYISCSIDNKKINSIQNVEQLEQYCKVNN